jgi:hypothetical protein
MHGGYILRGARCGYLTSSRASVDSVSASSEPECEPSSSLKSTPSASTSSSSTGPKSPSTETFGPFTLPLDLPTSSAAGSPAKTSASPGQEPALLANARAYGRSTPALLAKYDPDSSSWKTSQHCLLEGLATYSETWPRSGMTRNGTAYHLPPLVPLTDATVSGLLATPTTKANQLAPSMQKHPGCRRLWPTPRATAAMAFGKQGRPDKDARLEDVVANISERNGGLNPTWIEWLMGFPLGWTACELWATPSSRKSPKSSGGQ